VPLPSAVNSTEPRFTWLVAGLGGCKAVFPLLSCADLNSIRRTTDLNVWVFTSRCVWQASRKQQGLPRVLSGREEQCL